jgi:hypothetical protein
MRHQSAQNKEELCVWEVELTEEGRRRRHSGQDPVRQRTPVLRVVQSTSRKSEGADASLRAKKLGVEEETAKGGDRGGGLKSGVEKGPLVAGEGERLVVRRT